MTIDEKLVDQIKSQASHIMRMYESNEIEDKMIELACEWFIKGTIAAKVTNPELKPTLADLHSNE